MTKAPNIVYIEDEPFMIDMVGHVLKMSGYNFNVVGVTSGKQGLAIMRKQKTDILLLDLTMPNVNGWDVYREMKRDERLADIPVIVISATVPERGRTIVEELPPVDDYIIKPFNVKRLIRSIRKITEGYKIAAPRPHPSLLDSSA